MAKKKVKEPDRVLIGGKPDLDQCDNKVVSARYTALNFLPVVRVCGARSGIFPPSEREDDREGLSSCDNCAVALYCAVCACVCERFAGT